MTHPDERATIRDHVDLVELVSRHVKLKRVGSRMVGPCPFHHEKTPSFGVNVPEQYWKCFGCGKGGNCFDFLMEVEGIPFVEALKRLAAETGVPLRGYTPPPEPLRVTAAELAEECRQFWDEIDIEFNRAIDALRRFIRRGAQFMVRAGADPAPDPIFVELAFLGAELEPRLEQWEEYRAQLIKIHQRVYMEIYLARIKADPKLRARVQRAVRACKKQEAELEELAVSVVGASDGMRQLCAAWERWDVAIEQHRHERALELVEQWIGVLAR